MFKEIYKDGVGNIEEKKSKFICYTHYVTTEEEAVSFIEQIKKKNWDAKHNCYAYTIGDKNQNQKCSDDGEPSQTAGRPMLDVLLGEEIHNIVVVVTRYFGGVLLGTGGLVRAYQQAVKEGIKKSVIINKTFGSLLLIKTDYNSIGKIQYIERTMDAFESECQYMQDVMVKVAINEENKDIFINKIVEATSGKAIIEKIKTGYYFINDEILYF